MSPRRALLAAERTGDTDEIRRALTADDPTLRILALGSLARLDALSPTDVRNALADAHRDVRCRALEVAVAFVKHGERRVDAAEFGLDAPTLLADPDDLVVETTAWALGEVFQDEGDRTPAAVVSTLARTADSHEESICREAAVAALGAIGAEGGRAAILAALADRAPVRRRAVLALAPFDGSDVDEALVVALEDRDRQVRQAAADLLGRDPH